MDVFITIDVEVWCDGWDNLDAKFPEAFRKYVYGPTPRGDFGLPFILKTLRDHGLCSTCFTEPLFATRFGLAPLRELVHLITASAHDVQLHLHTEWVDEAREPILAGGGPKRQHLREFTVAEQRTLIAAGARLLGEAGAPALRAFRAGNFGFNRDTLQALRANGLDVDSSYNACMLGTTSGVGDDALLVQPVLVDEVYEYPVSCFVDGFGRLRHAQVGAMSFAELRASIEAAAQAGWGAFVIVLHNFELLTPDKRRLDRVVLQRFEQLCGFLAQHPRELATRGFGAIAPRMHDRAAAPLKIGLASGMQRVFEQGMRRVLS